MSLETAVTCSGRRKRLAEAWTVAFCTRHRQRGGMTTRFNQKQYLGRTLLVLLSIWVLAVLAAPGIPSPIQTPSEEYGVKAAFLFRFSQFVDWPPDVFQDADAPLNFCTIGLDPFKGALEGTLAGKKIGTHPARVLHFQSGQVVTACHMLFIGADLGPYAAKLLVSLQDSPIATIGDTDHFAQQGGLIGFCWENEKIRFEVNLNVAARAKLRISARLLSLAKSVIGGTKGTANVPS